MRQIPVLAALVLLTACGDYTMTGEQVWLDGAVFILDETGNDGVQMISAHFSRFADAAENLAEPMIDLPDDTCGYVDWIDPGAVSDETVHRDLGPRLDLEGPFGSMPLLSTDGVGFGGVVHPVFQPGPNVGWSPYPIMEPGDSAVLTIHTNPSVAAQTVELPFGSRIEPLSPLGSEVRLVPDEELVLEWAPTAGSDYLYAWFNDTANGWPTGWTCKLVNDGAATIDVPSVLNNSTLVLGAVDQRLLHIEGLEYPVLYVSHSTTSWTIDWLR